jgi:hypothetical protein
MEPECEDPRPEVAEAPRPKEPYSPPELTVHGTLGSLTKLLLFKGGDALTGSVPL